VFPNSLACVLNYVSISLQNDSTIVILLFYILDTTHYSAFLVATFLFPALQFCSGMGLCKSFMEPDDSHKQSYPHIYTTRLPVQNERFLAFKWIEGGSPASQQQFCILDNSVNLSVLWFATRSPQTPLSDNLARSSTASQAPCLHVPSLVQEDSLL
jgi:hypothetical protein